MNHQEKLRELSQRLDLHFGVDVRKSIMSGHEKLTWAVPKSELSRWMEDVTSRLRSLSDIDQGKVLTDIQYVHQLASDLNQTA
jgi:hypothetical protein